MRVHEIASGSNRPLIVQLSVLRDGDVLKVDFGVHVKGRIVDSAFTLSFDPTYDNLLTAVKEATETGIRVTAFKTYLFNFPDRLLICRKRVSMSVLVRLQPLYRRRWSHMRLKLMEKLNEVVIFSFLIYKASLSFFSQTYRKLEWSLHQ